MTKLTFKLLSERKDGENKSLKYKFYSKPLLFSTVINVK